MLRLWINPIFREKLDLKMETLSSFKKSVSIYQPTWPNVPEYLNHYQNLCDNLKSRSVKPRPLTPSSCCTHRMNVEMWPGFNQRHTKQGGGGQLWINTCNLSLPLDWEHAFPERLHLINTWQWNWDFYHTPKRRHSFKLLVRVCFFLCRTAHTLQTSWL